MTDPTFDNCENCGNDDLIDCNTKFCAACYRAYNEGYQSHDFDMTKKIATFFERERILKILNQRIHTSEFTSGICNCNECTEIRAIIHELTTTEETAK